MIVFFPVTAKLQELIFVLKVADTCSFKKNSNVNKLTQIWTWLVMKISKNIKGMKSNPEQKQFNFICNQQYKIILTVMKLLPFFFPSCNSVYNSIKMILSNVFMYYIA